jgi:hypothetical protein
MMPIARYGSIRICIEIAIVLIATILFQNFMPLLVCSDILDCVDDKSCHGTKKAKNDWRQYLKHNEGNRCSGSKNLRGRT